MNLFAGVADDPYQRVCAFCHTPHNAEPVSGPIWNRQVLVGPSGADPYKWAAPANMNISMPAAAMDPLIGPSRLCLACHDGTIAIDAHSGALISGRATVKDLTITHPIGFSYDDAMSARGLGELVDKNQFLPTGITTSNTAGVYNQVARNGSRRIKDVLFQGAIVTCSSCHDIHNCNNAKPDPGHDYNYLLWAKEEQSLICLTCHIK
jgi:hypothetical protein